MDQKEMASMGGKARAKSLTAERRSEIARNAGKMKGKKTPKTQLAKNDSESM